MEDLLRQKESNSYKKRKGERKKSKGETEVKQKGGRYKGIEKTERKRTQEIKK
jgi:hypothetical protein